MLINIFLSWGTACVYLYVLLDSEKPYLSKVACL